jgi:hypothetical protein
MTTVWPGNDSYALCTTQKLVWSANFRQGFLPPRLSSLKTFARSVQHPDDINTLSTIVTDCEDHDGAEVAFSALWRMSGSFSFLRLLEHTNLRYRPPYVCDSMRAITEDIWEDTRYDAAARVLHLLADDEKPVAEAVRKPSRNQHEVVQLLVHRQATAPSDRTLWLLKEYANQPDVTAKLRSWAKIASNALLYFNILSHWTDATDLDELLERIDNPAPEVSILLLNAAAEYSIRLRTIDYLEIAYRRTRAHVSRATFEELRGYVAVQAVGASRKI